MDGHQTVEEVERYTKAARRSKLADSGLAKLCAGKRNGKTVPTSSGMSVPPNSSSWT
jgi:hypothetical protein